MTESFLPQTNAIPGAGMDLHRRPGSPMEADPAPAGHAHWSEPERQEATVTVLKRAELRELTPVFGTAQPPHALSGLIRRFAYRVPEHRATHWALLLLGDRVDVLEHRVVEALPLVVGALAVAGGLRWAPSRRGLRALRGGTLAGFGRGPLAGLGRLLRLRRERAAWTRTARSVLRSLGVRRARRFALF